MESIRDSILILDKLIQFFPEFKSNNDLNHRYLRLYSILGSYEVALKYLELIKSQNPEDKISLMLHEVSLLLKMDQNIKAEALIKSIENEKDIKDNLKAELSLSVADLFAKEGDLEAALGRYNRAKSLFMKIGDQIKSIEVSEKMIEIYIKLNEYDEALEQIHFVYNSPLSEHDPNILFRFLKREGDIYFWKEDLVKAAEIYQHAFNISVNEDSTPLYPDFLLNQGKLQWLVGDNRNALNYFSNAYEIFDTNGDNIGKIKSLGNQAVVYRELGDYGKALSIELKTHDLTRRERDFELEIVSLNNLGQVYTDINQLSKAKSTFTDATNLSFQSNNWNELYRSYLGLSTISVKQKLLAEGKDYIQKASKLLDKLETEYLKNDIFYYRSRIDLYSSKYTNGKKNIIQFMEAKKMSFKHQAMGKLLLGELNWRSGKITQSLDILLEAFNIARLAGLNPIMQKVLWLKSQIHDSLHETMLARSALEHSVLLVYEIADTFENEIDRLMYVEAIEFSELFEAYKNR